MRPRRAITTRTMSRTRTTVPTPMYMTSPLICGRCVAAPNLLRFQIPATRSPKTPHVADIVRGVFAVVSERDIQCASVSRTEYLERRGSSLGPKRREGVILKGVRSVGRLVAIATAVVAVGGLGVAVASPGAPSSNAKHPGRGVGEFGMTAANYEGVSRPFTYSKGFYCDTGVSASATSGCEAGANFNSPPPAAGHFDPLYITVPLGFTEPMNMLQRPTARVRRPPRHDRHDAARAGAEASPTRGGCRPISDVQASGPSDRSLQSRGTGE